VGVAPRPLINSFSNLISGKPQRLQLGGQRPGEGRGETGSHVLRVPEDHKAVALGSANIGGTDSTVKVDG
jgi:hypothetical protein